MTAIRKTRLLKILLIVGLGLLLCAEAYFGYRVYILSGQQERIKTDYSVANNITFGILSVDQWREKVAAVVDGKINEFDFSAKQRRALQDKVEQQLTQLVNQTVNEINRPQKSIGGKLKKLAFNAFVDPEEIQAQVPTFASTIVKRLSRPASKNRLKSIVSSKIDQLENQTYDNTEPASMTVTRHVYKKYRVTNVRDFEKTVNFQLRKIKTQMTTYMYAMIGCLLLALSIWWTMRKQVRLHTTLYIFSLMFAFVLLWVGINATIIEVDARIQSLNFTLMGEKLAFTNQVLFFQSKSIVGVIRSLVAQPNFDSVLVGVLILLFVILLPMVRMIGKAILIWGRDKYADNKMVKFLAFDLGKWDMADVMVVGIAMTYIGLNGILQSQLANLNIQEELLSTTTQNNTSLQPGYYIFVAYVVYSAMLSLILKRIQPKSKQTSQTKWLI